MKKNFPRPAKCYLCGKELIGLYNNSSFGTFYITKRTGIPHKKECKFNFIDNEQSGNFASDSKKTKIFNNPNQGLLSFDKDISEEKDNDLEIEPNI